MNKKRLYLRDELSSGQAFLITRKELLCSLLLLFFVGVGCGMVAVYILSDPIACVEIKNEEIVTKSYDHV